MTNSLYNFLVSYRTFAYPEYSAVPLSIFSPILTRDTPQLACGGELCGVCCEIKIWFVHSPSSQCLWNIVINTPFATCMKFRMINLKFRILVMPWREVELFCHSKCNEILIKFDINALKPIQLHAIGFHRYTDWSIIEIIFQIERLNWNLV